MNGVFRAMRRDGRAVGGAAAPPLPTSPFESSSLSESSLSSSLSEPPLSESASSARRAAARSSRAFLAAMRLTRSSVHSFLNCA